jgi:alkanesulfonate monooxygenase SsuD/methylene tetrahydromethanopterin reductase-like flavin-dependent oxidoreductase (luciferase family)
VNGLRGVKFGVFVPFYAFKGIVDGSKLFSDVQRVTLECEQLGFDCIWLDDHLMYGNTPLLESWTTLAALACATSRIRLGTMVTSAGFPNAAVLAKMAASLDVLSGGRLDFGIGTGVQESEYKAFGLPFGTPRQRAERLSEALEVTTRMWTQPKATFTGKHFQLANAICEPKPVQKPHPPITVGGSGGKFTLNVTQNMQIDRLRLPT